MKRLDYTFFHRHALDVAPDLVGKLLIHNGIALRISETEAYCGVDDTACHAHLYLSLLWYALADECDHGRRK